MKIPVLEVCLKAEADEHHSLLVLLGGTIDWLGLQRITESEG